MDTLAELNPFRGGRKWRAFLLLLATVITFVMTDHITDENVIRDLLLGLFGVLGLGTVSERWVAAKTPQAPAQGAGDGQKG